MQQTDRWIEAKQWLLGSEFGEYNVFQVFKNIKSRIKFGGKFDKFDMFDAILAC